FGLLWAEKAPDAVVVARVRSKLGRYVSHPRSIEVDISDGRVILSGPVLEGEVPGLLRAISEVRGVCHVENRLEAHRAAGRESAVGSRGRDAAQAQSTSPGCRRRCRTIAPLARDLAVLSSAANGAPPRGSGVDFRGNRPGRHARRSGRENRLPTPLRWIE